MNWNSLRQEITSNYKDVFTEFFEIKGNNFRSIIGLLRKVLIYETGNTSLDGICTSVISELENVFDENLLLGRKENSLKILATELEPFLKKICLLKSNFNDDYTNDKRKTLVPLIKELNLSQKITNNTVKLHEEDIKSINRFRGTDSALYHLSNSYITRNDDVHNSKKYKNREFYERLESVVIFYLFVVATYYDELNEQVKSVPDYIENERYLKYITDILSRHNSFQLLKNEFGLNTTELEKFDLEIRVRQDKKVKEKSQYLSNPNQKKVFNNLKLFPEIDKLVNKSKYILAHGIATSGKTTLLKTTGSKFLKSKKDGLVFFIELGKSFEGKIKTSILDIIKNEYKAYTNQELALEVYKGKILLLLDGLDEVPNKSTRDNLILEITKFKVYKDVQIVLSSRTCDYIENNTLINNHFEKYELLPLNPKEMITLAQTIIKNDSDFKNFVTLIKKSELFNAFPKTPLTTILLAILFKEKTIDIKDLPRNITELYNKFMDIFLHKWDKSRGISEQFKIQQKEFVLKSIANYLQINNKISIRESELFEILNNLKKDYPLEIEDAKTFVERLCNRTSLFIKDIDDSYRFFHLTMQEFLTAKNFTYSDEKILLDNFYNEWWLNTNIFYAGRQPTNFDLLHKISELEGYYPLDVDSRVNYIIHTSKVLSAAHTIKKIEQRKVLESIFSIFNVLVKDVVNTIVGIEGAKNKIEVRVYRQTILDIIIFLRDFFNEFLGSTYFNEQLSEIWLDMAKEKEIRNYSDISLYCLAYCLSVQSKDSQYLLEFIDNENIDINVRWYKIVEVDIDIKKLAISNKKAVLKIKRKAFKHKKYIEQQFNQKLKNHYSSISGL
jgi:hypothetical protein